jgi:hypothetical protein
MHSSCRWQAVAFVVLKCKCKGGQTVAALAELYWGNGRLLSGRVDRDRFAKRGDL